MSKVCDIQRLWELRNKDQRRIIGLMSGTSLDGLDIALCVIQGSGPKMEIKVEKFTTVPYSETEKSSIRQVFAKEQVSLEHLCNLNAWIGSLHAKIILNCLKLWDVQPVEIDLIASHGQTVYHSPKGNNRESTSPDSDSFSNSTLQIGDGDHIAVLTGIITISDFRQKHIAAGGEGAPLALYGDYLIFSKANENRLLLNIGGIANFTCLFGDLDATKAFATDVGPGNTMIDAYVKTHFGKDFDEDGEFAKKGIINEALLRALKAHEFFTKPFPKTTGPELFNLSYLEAATVKSSAGSEENGSKDEPLIVSPFDVLATLTRFTGEVIAESIMKVEKWETFKVYTSGGGNHNPVLMGHLQQLLPQVEIRPTDDLGLNGDAKEAVLFATLANETVCGARTEFGNRRNVPSVRMGKVSFPS